MSPLNKQFVCLFLHLCCDSSLCYAANFIKGCILLFCLWFCGASELISNHVYVTGPVKQKKQQHWIKLLFFSLSIKLNMCFGYLKELSQCDGSFEYPQHMFG